VGIKGVHLARGCARLAAPRLIDERAVADGPRRWCSRLSVLSSSPARLFECTLAVAAHLARARSGHSSEYATASEYAVGDSAKAHPATDDTLVPPRQHARYGY
jgi:hypothetical protein